MGGKFKLLSLPCWGSQQPKLQNWNCKEWSRSPHSAPAHAPGGGCGGKGEGSKGARGWARTWSAHCRAFAAFARASKRTGVPGVSSFMTQPRTSSHRIFAGAAPRGRFRRPLSARDCFCFARRAAQYAASLTPGISAAAFNAGLQNMRGGSSERKKAA